MNNPSPWAPSGNPAGESDRGTATTWESVTNPWLYPLLEDRFLR